MKAILFIYLSFLGNYMNGADIAMQHNSNSLSSNRRSKRVSR
ncbi:hypothetical protein AT1219_30262 [Vibrio alginolyticus]